MKSYVKRASKLSVSAHNIEFFTFLSQFAYYAFPYFYSACCHTVTMRFHTYSLFVATLLQCVSVYIPHLLPLLCNTFLYIFPICCHSVAMRFCTYSLFVATTLQHVSSKMVMQKGRKCNALPTVWFYRNIATNKQNTYYTKTVATPCKYHKYTPKTQKRGKQLPFW